MYLLCDIFSVISLDHPGFHYSPDGDKKDSPQTKEGPTPRRGRRKGERLKNVPFFKKMYYFVWKLSPAK